MFCERGFCRIDFATDLKVRVMTNLVIFNTNSWSISDMVYY